MELGSFVILSGLVGGVAYKLSGFARSGFALLKRYCVTTIEINSQANLYYKFDSYITSKIKKNRIIELHSEETPQLLGSGLHYFFLKGTLCLLYKSIKTDCHNGGVIKTLHLTILTRNLNKIQDLINEIVSYDNSAQDYIEIQNNDHYDYWYEPRKIPKRSLNSIVIDKKIKTNLLEDIQSFLGKEEFYRNKGIVWKRGYCFHSVPGAGKSSLIRAIASEFDIKIYALDLSAVNDTTLRSLLTGLNKFSTPSLIGKKSYKIKDSVRLLVIEDIDAIFDGRENKVEGSKLTFSGLLNVLDGLNSTSGLITIITTNHLEKLDPALIRSGRIDKVIKLDLPTDDLIREMIGRFITASSEQEQVFTEIKSEGLVSMAQIQDKLIRRIL